MNLLKQTAAGSLGIFLAATAVAAGLEGFDRQMIALPAGGSAARFVDVDGDGRSDLLVVDRAGQRLLIYRQRASGFTNAPDQAIALPPQTAWFAFCNVESHPGLELLWSTAHGLVYQRQNDGVFEPEPRPLIKAEQVFRGDGSPGLITLTNATIPVISEAEAVLYRRNDSLEWSAGPPIALAARRSTVHASRGDWTLGESPSRKLRVSQFFRSADGKVDKPEPENDAIRKLRDDLKKAARLRPPGEARVDLDGDGRRDLVLWLVTGDMDCRTDVYVFLRGADDRLPERPTQILHCRGFPIPIGALREASPVGDLNGDGRQELVLLELKSAFLSASGLLEAALSRGLDWALTIRTFNRGSFSRGAEAEVAVTIPVEASAEWQIFVCGDFNGDGRPDLLVKRSTAQWDILGSTKDGRWFAPQPAMTFETPVPGWFAIEDLNGDGRSDIILRALDDARIFIYLSRAPQMKGRQP